MLRWVRRLATVGSVTAVSSMVVARAAPPSLFSSRPYDLLFASASSTEGAAAAVSSTTLASSSLSRLLPPVPKTPARSDTLQRLQSEEFDVLVIGGGIIGVATALEASKRGLKVAVVDQGDVACGTSSRSTKLIHGGVRYLEQAFKTLDVSMLHLVHEALRERGHMIHACDYANAPIPIVIPIEAWWEAPYMYVGTKMYELFARLSPGAVGHVPASRMLSKEETLQRMPSLDPKTLKCGILYYDGQMDDARYALTVARTAAAEGSTIGSYLEVTALTKDLQGQPGAPVSSPTSNAVSSTTMLAPATWASLPLTGAVVKDRLNPSQPGFHIRARSVVNATGPFADHLRAMDDPAAPKLVVPSVGVHIMLPADLCPTTSGLLVPRTPDGRVLFVLPWQGRSIAGTTDGPSEVTELPVATQKDVDYILDTLNHYTARKYTSADVLAAWSGFRPLVLDAQAAATGNTAKLSRQHVISVAPSGLTSIMGGKYTTHRQMAQDAVDALAKHLARTAPAVAAHVKPSTTFGQALLGVIDPTETDLGKRQAQYDKFEDEVLMGTYKLAEPVASHLLHRYGTHSAKVAELIAAKPALGQPIAPGYPFVEAEVEYAVDYEFALRAEDVLLRRTRLAFLDAQSAVAAAPRVVELMGNKLGWSATRKQEELMRARSVIATLATSPVGAV